MSIEQLKLDGITVTWSTTSGYECSTKGDKRFSAFHAMMPDGRSIEHHYQCDVKGYDVGGTNWRKGKGKPSLNTNVDLWSEYLNLWRIWANTHPNEMNFLAKKAIEFNYVLCDSFAKTGVNQAHALAVLINELIDEAKKEIELIGPIAIIGTAGRDKSKIMTMDTWNWMVQQAMELVPKGAHLVSGGAAWVDHLAVILFLGGHAKKLTLHLPAPFDTDAAKYIGNNGSSASAANYYHERFSIALGYNTMTDIAKAAQHKNCDGTFEQSVYGYSGMFARNSKVAASCNHCIAFTFGRANEPDDGGTGDTWKKVKGSKLHVCIPDF